MTILLRESLSKITINNDDWRYKEWKSFNFSFPIGSGPGIELAVDVEALLEDDGALWWSFGSPLPLVVPVLKACWLSRCWAKQDKPESFASDNCAIMRNRDRLTTSFWRHFLKWTSSRQLVLWPRVKCARRRESELSIKKCTWGSSLPRLPVFSLVSSCPRVRLSAPMNGSKSFFSVQDMDAQV